MHIEMYAKKMLYDSKAILRKLNDPRFIAKLQETQLIAFK